MRELDSELPLDAVGTVDALVATSFAAPLCHAADGNLRGSGAVAGHGRNLRVISYSVTQATQEIGIRMALGARRGHVLRMVFGYAGVLMAAGLILGIAAAMGAGRLLATQLFEVRPTDPATHLAVAFVLAVTGLCACAIQLGGRCASTLDRAAQRVVCVQWWGRRFRLPSPHRAYLSASSHREYN